MKIWRLVIASPTLWWLMGGGLFLLTFAYTADTVSFFKDPTMWMYLVYFTVPVNAVLTGWYVLFRIDSKDTVFNKDQLKDDVRLWTGISLVMLLLLSLIHPHLLRTVLLIFQLGMAYLLYRSPNLSGFAPNIKYLDSLIYSIPGLIGLTFAHNFFEHWQLALGLVSWGFAQSLYIKFNDSSKLRLITSGVCFSFSCLCLFFSISFHWLLLFSLIYPGIVLISLTSESEVYQRLINTLPLLNIGYAFMLYVTIILSKLN